MPPKPQVIAPVITRLKTPTYNAETPPRSFQSFVHIIGRLNEDDPHLMTEDNIRANWARVVKHHADAHLLLKQSRGPQENGAVRVCVKLAEEKMAKAARKENKRRSVSPSPRRIRSSSTAPASQEQDHAQEQPAQKSQKLSLPGNFKTYDRLSFEAFYSKLERCNMGVALEREAVDEAMERWWAKMRRLSNGVEMVADRKLKEWRDDAKAHWAREAAGGREGKK